MKTLYPLQFEPIFKYRIWGGDQLKDILHKNTDQSQIGESWEISNVEGDVSTVKNGELKGASLRTLIEDYKEALVGKRVYETYKSDFPLLIKFIDANLPLSVQVHPDDDLARKRHNSFGKNEMWYIMNADAEANLVMGLKESVTKETYQQAVANEEIGALLNHTPVNKGDTYYIPAGKVHAIGAGILLAEIQQSSDITYRIYDYDRVDSKTNQKRELHLDQALDAIDFDSSDNQPVSYNTTLNTPEKLVHTPYFKTDILAIDGSMAEDATNTDTFIIYMNVGDVEVTFKVGDAISTLKKGETLFMPATITNFTVQSKAKATLLKVYMG
ncbi:class I mannose-6-phosphate isomerase [Aquimarina sp. ERC-38]|uniref:type I phosphomannose isomerase catalytic subunit n=1 Tax=Aquimarina sp. ERC-38 TaxID=2949996 RepID=UPI0022482F01|nr:type I phosphomannose isomerase catalytic subunit [Aquimarina sp. ERC-38]UZO81124.1 class I mannose-6-phosphate isomerase [Aquimarina sp. ERC-38]